MSDSPNKLPLESLLAAIPPGTHIDHYECHAHTPRTLRYLAGAGTPGTALPKMWLHTLHQKGRRGHADRTPCPKRGIWAPPDIP